MTHSHSPDGLPLELSGLTRCLVMSVLNVTPDSFSDGGAYLAPAAAISHGIAQHKGGADLVDVGGESTRPGAQRIPVDVELERVLPVVEGLVEAHVPVSIDTMRAVVAERAVSLGATVVNDVSGGLADPEMFGYLAEAKLPVVLMHWRGHSASMQSKATYPRGAVEEVCAELSRRIDAAVAAGVDPGTIVVDPGLGFAKEPSHNWELLHGLKALRALGRPVLLGASRKRFLGELLSDDAGVPREMGKRDEATVAVSALAAAAGAWCVRVHEARGSADAVRVAAAWDGDRS